jgi:hypothetical protein
MREEKVRDVAAEHNAALEAALDAGRTPAKQPAGSGE